MKLRSAFPLALLALAFLQCGTVAADPGSAVTAASQAIARMQGDWDRKRWESDVGARLDEAIPGIRPSLDRLTALEVAAPKSVDPGLDGAARALATQKRSLADLQARTADPRKPAAGDASDLQGLARDSAAAGAVLMDYGYGNWVGVAAAYDVSASANTLLAFADPRQAGAVRGSAAPYRAYFKRALDPLVPNSLAATRKRLADEAAEVTAALAAFPRYGRVAVDMAVGEGDFQKRSHSCKVKTLTIADAAGGYAVGALADFGDGKFVACGNRELARVAAFPGFPPASGDSEGPTRQIIAHLNGKREQLTALSTAVRELDAQVAQVEQLLRSIDSVAGPS